MRNKYKSSSVAALYEPVLSQTRVNFVVPRLSDTLDSSANRLSTLQVPDFLHISLKSGNCGCWKFGNCPGWGYCCPY